MITTLQEAKLSIKKLQGVTVFVGGCFDLMHGGHIEFLDFAKSLGDHLLVGVVSDKRVRERKDITRPILPQTERMLMVDSIRFVDFTFLMPMPQRDKSPTIICVETLQPDIFVLFTDSKYKYADLEAKLLANGTELVIDERPKRNSTTRVINKIQQSYVQSY